MYAFCYASGLIEFGQRVPDGALPIARGRSKVLRAFIDAKARHDYQTRLVKGRPTKIPGTDNLLVPGVPEAANQIHGLRAFHKWCGWIGEKTPVGVIMMSDADGAISLLAARAA